MLTQHQPHSDLRAETARRSSAAPPGAPRAISPLSVLLSLVLKHAQLLPQFRAVLALLLMPAGLWPEISNLVLIVLLISVHLSPLGELALTMACKIPHPCGLGWHHAKWNKSETDKHCAISLTHGA